jgi:hypothetical protein
LTLFDLPLPLFFSLFSLSVLNTVPYSISNLRHNTWCCLIDFFPFNILMQCHQHTVRSLVTCTPYLVTCTPYLVTCTPYPILCGW